MGVLVYIGIDPCMEVLCRWCIGGTRPACKYASGSYRQPSVMGLAGGFSADTIRMLRAHNSALKCQGPFLCLKALAEQVSAAFRAINEWLIMAQSPGPWPLLAFAAGKMLSVSAGGKQV